METDRSKNQLFKYCVFYWARHAQLALDIETHEIQNIVEEFVFEDGDVSPSFTEWMNLVAELLPDPPVMHPMGLTLDACISSNHLHTASAFGFYHLITNLAQNDWNTKNKSGHTPLYVAAVEGHPEVVRWLVSQGVDVNIVCGWHRTALQAACFRGHLSVAECLLQNGANSRLEGPYGHAFATALKLGHEKTACLVLKNGFDIRCQQEFNEAVTLASYGGLRTVLQTLITQYGGTFSSDIPVEFAGHCMVKAAFKGQSSIIQRGFKYKSTRRFFGEDARFISLDSALLQSTLVSAALGGQNAIVSHILNEGACIGLDVEGPFGTPLRAACLMGHIATAKLLVGRGAEINMIGTLGDALQAAAWQGHVDVVQYLLSSGAKTNNVGGPFGSALHAAAFAGHQDLVGIFLENGSDIQQGSFEDVFVAAVEGRHTHILEFLIERGYKVPKKVWAPFGYANCASASYYPPRPPKKHIIDWEQMEWRNLQNEYDVVSGIDETHGSMELTIKDVPFVPLNVVDRRLKEKIGLTQDLSTFDRNLPPKEEQSLLGFVASMGMLEIVLMIFEAQSQDISPDHLQSAVMAAVRNGHLHVVTFLINEINAVAVRSVFSQHLRLSQRLSDRVTREAIETSVLWNHGSVLDFLLQNTTEASKQVFLYNAYEQACKHTSSDGPELALGRMDFGQLDTRGLRKRKWALVCAIRGRHVTVVRELLKLGADPSHFESEDFAPRGDWRRNIDCAVSYRRNNTSSPVHLAALLDSQQIMEHLLNYWPPQAGDTELRKSLNEAVLRGNTKMAQTLVRVCPGLASSDSDSGAT